MSKSTKAPKSGPKPEAKAEPKYVRYEVRGSVLIVSPLFTFARFTEADIHQEWKAVEKTLSDPAIKHVVVDLGSIPYFGSTVLEWMVQMWKRVKAKGGKLMTCNVSHVGREVLAAARFDILWDNAADASEALAKLGQD
jgi:anti-anti-sigma factor